MSALDKLAAKTAPVPVHHAPVRARTITTGDRRARYVQAALEGEAERVRTAVEGTRNQTLNAAAFACARLAELTDDDITGELSTAARECGLASSEAIQTIASGIAGGRKAPREIPEPTMHTQSHEAPECDWTPSDDEAPDAPPVSETVPAGIQEQAKALTAPKKRSISFSDVVEQWRQEGQIVRVPTGIPSLDNACGGGLPLPRRVLIIGAPSAGKTYFETVIADTLAFKLSGEGFCVGIMAVDEDPSDIGARFAQMRGFTQDDIDNRDPAVLDAIEQSLRDAQIRFYDCDWTIEDATADLVAWAAPTASRCVLCVDSLHSVRSDGSDCSRNAKEYVDANCKALKVANERHRITIVATGEMTRSAYASEKFANDSNAMAAAADSRMPEFWAQTLLKLTTPKDCPDMVKVEIAKNRRAKKGVKFWLQLDREHHGLHEVGDPDENPEVVADRQADKAAKVVRKNSSDALTLARFIDGHQGLNSRKLRIALSTDAGLTWGVSRLDTALSVLEGNVCPGYSYRADDGPNKQIFHFIERTA